MEKWDQYVEDVLSDKIVVGKYVRKAVERHVSDLARVGDDDFPYHFDAEKAEQAVSFFPSGTKALHRCRRKEPLYARELAGIRRCIHLWVAA